MKKIIPLSLLLLSIIIVSWCSTKPTTTESTETTTSIETWTETDNETTTTEAAAKPEVEKTKPTPAVKPPVKETTTTPPPAETPTETPPAETPGTYTLAVIAMHDTKWDCWTAINGNVYNITSAFGKHPWWDAALAWLCGIEGTAKFNAQHWDNEKAKWRLATLKIWVLK